MCFFVSLFLNFFSLLKAELAGERVAVKKIKDEVKDARMQLSNEVPLSYFLKFFQMRIPSDPFLF